MILQWTSTKLAFIVPVLHKQVLTDEIQIHNSIFKKISERTVEVEMAHTFKYKFVDLVLYEICITHCLGVQFENAIRLSLFHGLIKEILLRIFYNALLKLIFSKHVRKYSSVTHYLSWLVRSNLLYKQVTRAKIEFCEAILKHLFKKRHLPGLPFFCILQNAI